MKTTLWRLADFINGYGFKPSDFSDSGLPVVRIRQLVDREAKFDLFDGRLESKYLIDDGDLIFSWSGSLAVRVWDRGEAFLNQHLFKVEPAVGVHKAWLRWLIESCIPRFEGLMHGSTMTHLNLDMLRLPVELPSFDEQRRITDFLDSEVGKIEEVIELRGRQVSLIRERMEVEWSSLILDVGDGEDWIPLRRFVQEITDGPFGSSLTSGHYVDEGARVIRLGNIGRSFFKGDDEAYISLDYFNDIRRHKVNPGDLVVAGLGDGNNLLGRACVVPDGLGPAIVKADCFRLVLNQDRLLHDYAAWALSSRIVADQIILLSRGSTRARINLGIVREVSIPVPKIDKQIEISKKLQKLRSESLAVIHSCECQIDLLEERKRALITAAVTGQIDVTTARGADVS